MRWAVVLGMIAIVPAPWLFPGLPAAAQEPFPARPIELIVPQAAGGGLDTISRLLAAMAADTLGQRVVVINKPGAGGAIGTQAMVAARPDGYTIAGEANTTLTVTPNATKVPYTIHSYTPILQSDVEPLIFCVRKQFPADTGAQLLQVLKASPGKYTFGTDGPAGGSYLAGKLIFSAAGADLRPIPYEGAGPELAAFLSGSIDLYGGIMPAMRAYIANGEAKCLLLSTAKPNPALPGAAGLAQLGIPQAELMQWHGYVAPAGVPPDRLRVLTAAFAKAARSPKFRDFMQAQGGQAVAVEGAAFGEIIASEYAKVAAIMARAAR